MTSLNKLTCRLVTPKEPTQRYDPRSVSPILLNNNVFELQKRVNELKKIIFKHQIGNIRNFVKEKSRLISKIQEINLFMKNIYIEIWILVEKGNIKATRKISELTYDIRKKYEKLKFDFKLIDYKCFYEEGFEEEVDFYRIY